MLADRGVIASPFAFRLAARVAHSQGALRAGEYAFPARVSVSGVLDTLISGAVVMRRLTVVEGWTVAQALASLDNVPGLEGPVPIGIEEGLILPETYFYTWGETRVAVVARMRAAMNRMLADAWADRASGLPLDSAREALILASIVERETAIDDERPRVAAVFENRLRKAMRLQSDPTVIYGLSDGLGIIDRPLTRADLAADHLFNTYVIDGLPPGPICLPGAKSIQAVLHPADTDDLYFVADGSGGHVFSKTLDAHNRHVREWHAREKANKR